MSKSMYMFDDIDISLDPPGAYAYAGYVDGKWANFSQLEKTFPKAHLLSITVFGNKAQCADVENGDMTNADVYGWFLQMQADGVWRPCVYTSASNAYSMQATMKANGFARDEYRLWTAHYTGTAHFCSPNTCGYGMDQADATQFTDHALGKSLDESIIADDFFGPSNSINPVHGLEVTRRGWTSLSVAWKPVDAYYTVEVFRKRSMRLKPRSGGTTTATAFRCGHLWPGATYEIKVRAHPDGGTGPSARVDATTRPAK